MQQLILVGKMGRQALSEAYVEECSAIYAHADRHVCTRIQIGVNPKSNKRNVSDAANLQ